MMATRVTSGRARLVWLHDKMAKHKVVLLGAMALLCCFLFTAWVSSGTRPPQRLYETGWILQALRGNASGVQAAAASDDKASAGTQVPWEPPLEVSASHFSEMDPGYTCLPPLAKGVRFHIVMGTPNRTSYRAYDALRRWGLTGAEVFTYLRQLPKDLRRFELQLPCGMRHHERLLLPNHGEEGAPFAVHVAAFYDDLPDILVLLHDAKSHSWHAECSITLRRLQAVHLGLQPGAPPVLRAFAQSHRTLNGHHNCHVETCCGPLFCRIETQEPDPTCPWRQVGVSSVEFRNQTAICQLRDNTDPATNYTVLSIDVPHFFYRKNEILAGYEKDPGFWGVPITWRRVTPPSPQLKRRKLASVRAAPHANEGWHASHYDHDAARHKHLRAALQPDGALHELNPGQLVNMHEHARARRARGLLSTAPDNLTNTYDDLFPWVEEDMPHFGAWGLTKIWGWLLAYHNMLQNTKQSPGPDERKKNFCCFQFTIPAAQLKRAPRAFYEDLAWITNNKAWSTEARFAHNIGRLFEFHFFDGLGLQYTTLEDSSAYVLVDQHLGASASYRYDECDREH